MIAGCWLLLYLIRWSGRQAKRTATRERIAELQRRKVGLEEHQHYAGMARIGTEVTA